MPTVEGFELLSNFAGIFTFLFTFAVVYGVLSVTNLFGEKTGKAVNPIIALAMAMMASFSSMFIRIVAALSPWLIVAIIAIFFILLFLRFLGLEQSTISDFFSGTASEKRTVIYWTISIVVIVVALVVSIEIGDEVGPYVKEDGQSDTGDTGDAPPDDVSGDSFAENLGAALFHPKVIGSFLIMLFASLSIRQLANTK
ncbi:MAG: hypothetical protein ACLFTR_02940 [Candidatus Woesearchaeota archaeon]